MDPQNGPTSSRLWQLVRHQHGVVTRRQLLDAGLTPSAIKHRRDTGRLHPVSPGVYAVGRPELSLHGRWIAAVLSCGPGAALSHESAAALWGIRAERAKRIEVSVPRSRHPRRAGIHVYRRTDLGSGLLTRRHGIPITTPVCTLIDLATCLSEDALEAAINEADRLDLVSPPALRSALARLAGRPGVPAVREVLDRRTFRLTQSQLERYFLPLARRAGLPTPDTQRRVNGFRVDFHWPDLGLVVETDGLRYHRTPAQQAKDRVRDQAHAAAGLTPLRFTHEQIRFEPDHVRATLVKVAWRLKADG
jgi:very-short-patch-repair endonuclease